MFIHNLQNTGIEVNPNIVSGADYDNRMYSNYAGDQDELLRLHNSIVKAKAEVVEGKKRKAEAEKELMDLHPFLSHGSKEWGRLISLKQRGVITDPVELEKLEMDIAKAKAYKDEQRFKYSALQSELSKLDTYINSREQGSIFGMMQKFKEISGKEYDGTFEVSENSEIENVSNDPDNFVLMDNVSQTNGSDLPPVKENLLKKGVNTISDKTGLSKNQTYVALGVVSVLIIAKILK